jgi:hypothetical protein
MPRRKKLTAEEEAAQLEEFIAAGQSSNRGESLNTQDFTFDDGSGDLDVEPAKRNKLTGFRLTEEQHRIWKEWCVRHDLTQSDAFLEAFQLLRNKRGA